MIWLIGWLNVLDWVFEKVDLVDKADNDVPTSLIDCNAWFF